MNLQETTAFYAQCMAVRQWLKPLSEHELKAWAFLLEEVPAREGLHLIKEMMGNSPRSDEYRFFEPQTVLKAWEAVKEYRRGIIDRVHSIDRYLRIESDPQVIEEKQQRRAELIAKLPAHVVEYAGIGQQQLNPPPKYKSKQREVTSIDFGGALKKV